VEHPGVRWSVGPREAGSRLEWQLAYDLQRELSYDELWWAIVAGRRMCLPFLWLGTLSCYQWARAIYGTASGLLAATLWSFCPNVLAWGSTLGPDIPATALGCAAVYSASIWINERTWTRGMVTGIVLGLAILAKFTCFILLVVVLGTALFATRPGLQKAIDRQRTIVPTAHQVTKGRLQGKPLSRTSGRIKSDRWTGQVLLVGGLSVAMVNLGYGFSGTGNRLGQFSFHSRLLTGQSAQPGVVGNRWAHTPFGGLPAPFPKDLILGVDQQKADFERGKWSYLAGEWKDRGWWHYYLICALVKMPLGFWGLVLLASVDVARSRSNPTDGYPVNRSERPAGVRRFAAGRCFLGNLGGVRVRRPVPNSLPRATQAPSHVLLCVSALAVIVVVSSEIGFSRHFRYAFPCLPFLFVQVSRAARTGAQRITKSCSYGMLLWFSISSISTWPLQHSYFNELVGGPGGGHRTLLDSNLDWGEDVFLAHEWAQRHASAKPLFYVFVNDEFARSLPTNWQPAASPPRAGWYLASIHRVLDPRDDFHFLQNLAPCDRIGYSIWVYQIPDRNRFVVPTQENVVSRFQSHQCKRYTELYFRSR
jgi:hypothetical protein